MLLNVNVVDNDYMMRGISRKDSDNYFSRVPENLEYVVFCIAIIINKKFLAITFY